MTTKWGVIDDTDKNDEALRDAFDNINQEINADEPITEEDIKFVLSVMSKEAPHDKHSIKQVFYGMCSAFTKIVIHHAISSRNTGAGKTYILVLVAGYMPKMYVIPLTGMTDKAMLHKAGTMVVENLENGQLESLDSIIALFDDEKEAIDDKLVKLPNDNNNRDERKRLGESLKEIDAKIKETKSRAEKLIVLENKIVLLLDTTQDNMFNALMSIVSQDTKEDQKYEYVETNGSPMGTKANRIRGVPAIFTCQVVDDSRQVRYAEKNRRFIHVIPNTGNEKIKTAISHTGFRYGLLDEEYDLEIVSRDEKEKAMDICSRLAEKLIKHSKNFEPKQSGVKIFFNQSISHSIIKETNDVWAMTVADRIFKYLTIITKINMDSRPRIVDTVIPDKFYPISTFEDLEETLSLMDLASSTLRPYIVDWYNRVFIPTFRDVEKNPIVIKDEHGNIIMREMYAGVNTKMLADRTAEVLKVQKSGSETLLRQYLYPLLNLGVIDKFKSSIDGRAYLYAPAEEGNINTMFSNSNDKRLEIFDPSHYPCKKYIEDSCRTIKEYCSEGGGVNGKRYKLVDSKGFDITFEELIDRYLSNPAIAFKESVNKAVPPLPCSNNLTEFSKNVTEESSNRVNGNQNQNQNQGIWSCPHCDNRFQTEEEFREHVDSSHHPPP